MQYETILLELMTRIKKLEEDVAALKEAVGDSGGRDEGEALPAESGEAAGRRGQGVYKK